MECYGLARTKWKEGLMNELAESYSVVEPDGSPPNERKYIHVPRRSPLDALREVAEGKWRSVVFDREDAAELLALLSAPAA
jgi:hypothetical protein